MARSGRGGMAQPVGRRGSCAGLLHTHATRARSSTVDSGVQNDGQILRQLVRTHVRAAGAHRVSELITSFVNRGAHACPARRMPSAMHRHTPCALRTTSWQVSMRRKCSASGVPEQLVQVGNLVRWADLGGPCRDERLQHSDSSSWSGMWRRVVDWDV